jgi:hypothetical protein
VIDDELLAQKVSLDLPTGLLRTRRHGTGARLQPGREYVFRYLVNGEHWCNEWHVDARPACVGIPLVRGLGPGLPALPILLIDPE